jgi:hypothetical protein
MKNEEKSNADKIDISIIQNITQIIHVENHNIFNIFNNISTKISSSIMSIKPIVKTHSRFFQVMGLVVAIVFGIISSGILPTELLTKSEKTDDYMKYDTIPTWVKKTGPFKKTVFDDGSSISFDLGPTELMYLPTKDGQNVLIPEGLEFSSIIPIFGPYIEFDQKSYSTIDKVYITIIDFWRNTDPNTIEKLGSAFGKNIEITTKSGNHLDYIFTETGKDTGIFTGEIQLTGPVQFDLNNDGIIDTDGETYGQGPYNGILGTTNDDELIIRYYVTPENYISNSVSIKMIEGKISIHQNKQNPEKFFVYLDDWDINLNYFEEERATITITSDSDPEGVLLVLFEETFSGTFFREFQISELNGLTINPGDKLSVVYEDRTLPSPYTLGDSKKIVGSTMIEQIPSIIKK